MINETDPHQEIRDAVRQLCREFPDEYFRKIDEQKAYPEGFVEVLFGRVLGWQPHVAYVAGAIAGDEVAGALGHVGVALPIVDLARKADRRKILQLLCLPDSLERDGPIDQVGCVDHETGALGASDIRQASETTHGCVVQPAAQPLDFPNLMEEDRSTSY